jgi:hypothetical protein
MDDFKGRVALREDHANEQSRQTLSPSYRIISTEQSDRRKNQKNKPGLWALHLTEGRCLKFDLFLPSTSYKYYLFIYAI